jgi:hypothetical protein
MAMNVDPDRRSHHSPWAVAVALALALGAIGLGPGCGGSDDDGDNGNPVVPSATQVLRVGNAAGSAGGTAEIILSLENTEPLSGLQFDLLYDPSVLTVTDAVTTARTAGFEIGGSTGPGTARVLLTDLGGTAEVAPGDGAVVTLTVEIAGTATAGTSEIATAGAVATDRSATTISLGSASATFTVR